MILQMISFFSFTEAHFDILKLLSQSAKNIFPACLTSRVSRITDVVKDSSLVNTVGEKSEHSGKGGENRGSLEEISSVLLLIPEKRQGRMRAGGCGG